MEEAFEEVIGDEAIFDGLIEGFYFITLALILAFGTITTTGTLLQTDKPVVSVVSCSMYPEYHKGDILVVNGQEYSEIEEGDVVIYKVPDRIDFTLNDEKYTLEENSPDHNTSISTSSGKISLLEVKADLNNGNDKALISVDGERITVSDGETISVSGEEITVERISAMPIPVVHRVISKNDDYLETKGDANNAQLDFESDVRPFQIHGTTMFTIPRIGAVKILAMDFIGFQGDKPFLFDVYRPC